MAMQIDQSLLSRSQRYSEPMFNVRPDGRLQPMQIRIKFLYVCISAVRLGPQSDDQRLSPVEKRRIYRQSMLGRRP
jgi:hypothetical protein